MHDSFSAISTLKTGLTAGLLYWHKLKRDLQRSSCSLGLSVSKLNASEGLLFSIPTQAYLGPRTPSCSISNVLLPFFSYPSKSIQRCEAVTPSSHLHPNTTTRIQPVVVRNDPKGCWHPASRKPGQAWSCAKLIDVIPGTWFIIIIPPGPIQVERTWRKIDWKYGTTGGYATLSFITSNLLKKTYCESTYVYRFDEDEIPMTLERSEGTINEQIA